MESLPPTDGSSDADTNSSSWYLKKVLNLLLFSPPSSSFTRCDCATLSTAMNSDSQRKYGSIPKPLLNCQLFGPTPLLYLVSKHFLLPRLKRLPIVVVAEILYQVTVYTGADSTNDTNFTVFLNIFGSKGDIGQRSLRNAAGTQPDSIFKPSNVCSSFLRTSFSLFIYQSFRLTLSIWKPSVCRT